MVQPAPNHARSAGRRCEARYNNPMQNVIETATVAPESPAAPPTPKIDPSDALTVVPRLLAGFFLGGLAVMYVVAQNWGMVAFLGASSAMLLFWAFRLISKMRRENTDYIAYRAAAEASDAAAKRARTRR